MSERRRYGDQLTRPMYPVEQPLQTRDEIERYYSGDQLVCLLCGFEFRALAKHLVCVHGMTAAEYQDRFGLPRRGLVGQATSARQAAQARAHHTDDDMRALRRQARAVPPPVAYRRLPPYRILDAAAAGRKGAAPRAQKTHCIRGHPLSGDNLRVSRAGKRSCVTCAKWRRRLRYHRRRQ